MSHPFRFAAQLSRSPDGTGAGWAAQARKAEDMGFSALHMPDHFGDQLAPIAGITAAAAATEHLRVGAMVFDNDYRHPLVLAKEFASLDVLSGGRLEMSLGAGWMLTDYEQSGLPYDPPAIRVDRFEEAVAIVKGMLSAEGPFSFAGKHYTITDYDPLPRPVQRPRPPLIIGGGGRRVLSIAGREADIVSINVDLRGGKGDADVAPNAAPEQTRRKIAWVKEAAGSRFEELELHTLVGFVLVTDDRQGVIDAMAPSFGIDPTDAVHIPLALIGSLEQMEEELQWRRAEYGISYYSIESDSWETLAPMVAKLAGT